MKNKRLKIFLICLFSFLFISSASIAGGILLSNNAGGGNSQNNILEQPDNIYSDSVFDNNSTYELTYMSNGGTEIDSDYVRYGDTYGKSNLYNPPSVASNSYFNLNNNIYTLNYNNYVNENIYFFFEQPFDNTYSPNAIYTVVVEVLSFSGDTFALNITSPFDSGSSNLDVATSRCQIEITNTGIFTAQFNTLENIGSPIDNLRSYVTIRWQGKVSASFRISIFTGNVYYDEFLYSIVGFTPSTNRLPTPLRLGYTFEGWFLEPTFENQVTSSTIVSTMRDHTLYAKWEANQYNVSYSSVGSIVGEKIVTFNSQYGDLLSITRDGYTFEGWFLEENFENQVSSSTFVSTVGNHTLYAKWEANQYNVSYSSVGSIVGNKTVTFNSQYGELLSITREGYTFQGWFFEESFQNQVFSTSIVSQATNHTLFAKWSANQYNVTYISDGLIVDSKTVTFNASYGDLLSMSREGYTFGGWFLEDSFVTKIEPNSIVFTSQDHRLYALWIVNVQAFFDEDGQYWYIEMGEMPQTKVTDNLIISALNNDSTLDDNDGVTTSSNVYWFTNLMLAAKVYNGEEYCNFNGDWYLVEPIKWRLDTPVNSAGYISVDTLAVTESVVYIGQYSNSQLGIGQGYVDANNGKSMVSYFYNNINVNERNSLVEFTIETENFSIDGNDRETSSGSIFLSSDEEINDIFGSYGAEFSDLVKDYLSFNKINPIYFVRDLGTNLNNITCHTESGGTINQRPTTFLGMRFTIKVTEFVCI